jgi:hypothetical protein
MNADADMDPDRALAEILVAIKALPDAEFLDLLTFVEKEAGKRNLR